MRVRIHRKGKRQYDYIGNKSQRSNSMCVCVSVPQGECGSSSVIRYVTLTESRCPYPYTSLPAKVLGLLLLYTHSNSNNKLRVELSGRSILFSVRSSRVQTGNIYRSNFIGRCYYRKRILHPCKCQGSLPFFLVVISPGRLCPGFVFAQGISTTTSRTHSLYVGAVKLSNSTAVCRSVCVCVRL